MFSVNSYGMTLEVVGNRRSVLPRGVHGAADPHFACAVRSFASMFPGRRYGGGALAVYLDGEPVVDVWTGWSDRRGRVPWTADTATMVFSATKGMASTVIHRLVDRGLIDYDAPVAEYWREFGANGKSNITVRQMMRHQAGLSALHGASKDDLLNHELMEERLAAARPGYSFGRSAYHALTYGWLVSGLARAVTGQGMRELIRQELAEPLNTDGLHLGRPPAESPTRPAQIIMPQSAFQNPDIQRGGAEDCRAATVRRIRLYVLPGCESCCTRRYPVHGRGNPGGQRGGDGARAGSDVRCDRQRRPDRRHPVPVPRGGGGPQRRGEACGRTVTC